MIKIGDCPHCHSRVAVGREGICPNCRRDTNDPTGVDPDMSTLHVKQGVTLPDLCCLCGVTTRRKVRVEDHTSEPVHEASNGQFDGDALAFAFLGGLFSLLGLLVRVFGRLLPNSRDASVRGGFNYRSVATSVPQCEICSNSKIVPLESDFDHQTIKILVCDRFRSAYEHAKA